MALITVTWLLALIALLAGSALTVARTSSRLAANRLAVAQAEALADSAIRRALLSLLSTRAADRWPIGGEVFTFVYRNTPISVHIVEESGRIDINGADADLLSAAFAANGVPPREARVLAARMIDWRDADELPVQDGAELSEYRARGVGYAPRNGPFETPDEIWLVLGMPQELRGRLDGLFTAFTGQPGIDEHAATGDVQAVFRWADAQHWGGRQWLAGLVAPPEVERSLAGRVFRIRAKLAPGKDDAAVQREAVIRMTGNLRQPALIYAWSTRPADRASH